MKKIFVLVITIVLLGAVMLTAEVKNPDKPLKGQWNFKIKKLWSLDSAGEDPLTDIGQLSVSEKGSIYLKDYKYKINYIFDRDGKFVKSFAPVGEGPGEVKRQAGIFVVNDSVLIIDIDKIHYFSPDGKYLKSVKNNFYSRRPACFINEDEFIAISQITARNPQGKGKIRYFNLKSQQETLLREFTFYKGGTFKTPENTFVIMVESLTPAMILGYDDGSASGKQRIYFGMNHTYEVDGADLKGKVINTFSLDREKSKITRQDKLKRWKNTPEERRQRIIKATPNQLNYFIRLEVHNGLVYALLSQLDRGSSQAYDIFSPGGKYLYRAVIDLGEELTFSRPQRYNPVIKGNYLYAVVEDEEGTVMINKYKLELPVIK